MAAFGFATQVPCPILHLSREYRLQLGSGMRPYDRPIIVLSNREPYRHDHAPQSDPADQPQIRCTRSVSGVVSTLEPILLKHGGIWIAQGTGSADGEVVNSDHEMAIPGEDAFYRLRRVFLSQKEVAGHTHGFSNQALWPLCHAAALAPVYDATHWAQYVRVNETFASAVTDRDLNSDPWILVQDFHLALVPALIRARRPQAALSLFWHTPWPEPTRLARCPWSKDLIVGMLGARVIGFHTPEDVSLFLEACARLIPCRIDWGSPSIEHEGRLTQVRALPVGIEPPALRPLEWEQRGSFWRSHYGIDSPQVALAVDRIDFTKGILERLNALDLLLQRRPNLKGALTLVQVAPPCRSELSAYRELESAVAERARALNDRHAGKNPAVVLISQALSWPELSALYQMADHCLATPLHDGMNLVSKEYIWSAHHCRGDLVLSRFAGASRQLPEAWIVNPHDTAAFAHSWERAIHSTAEDRRSRMGRMRERILPDTSTRWTHTLLSELDRAWTEGT